MQKIKYRKRHIVVDIMVNLLALYIHSANIHEITIGIIPAILTNTAEEDVREF